MAATATTQTVLVSELPLGKVLTTDLVDARNTGVRLLKRGTTISQQLLDQLAERGVKHVSVDRKAATSSEVRSIPQSPVPSQPLHCRSAAEELSVARELAARQLQALFDAAKQGSLTNSSMARRIVADAIARIHADIDSYLKVALQTTECGELFEHCLATAQLAVCVGLTEGLEYQEILDLGTGCVLSRVGQSDVASRVAEKTRELTRIEEMDLKRTPSRTFDFLQDLPDVTVAARNVAFQIFERFDGSGYPRGRRGSQITRLARLAAVCDVYVALTSPRPHRQARSPYTAVEILLEETRDGKFDPLATRALLRTIGLFPIGSFVRLTDGSIGQVVRNHHDKYDRPVIHLFLDAAARLIRDEEHTVDLLVREDLGIATALPPKVVADLLSRGLSGETDT